jgi:hypothetical protein
MSAAHAVGFGFIALWISLFKCCLLYKCGAAYLDLLHSASHASRFTTSVLGAFSWCDILTRRCGHYMLNVIMSNVGCWWIILGREVLIGCGAVMEIRLCVSKRGKRTIPTRTCYQPWLQKERGGVTLAFACSRSIYKGLEVEPSGFEPSRRVANRAIHRVH